MKAPTSKTDQLPDNTFWRISVKALIYDDRNRLLVFMDKHHEWEIPGGGWEHSETLEECVRRELAEEVKARVIAVSDEVFCYTGSYHFRGDEVIKWFPKINIAVKVTVDGSDIEPVGDDLAEAKFVAKEEFLALPFQRGEDAVKEYIGRIWPS